jgi:hypothetical protein
MRTIACNECGYEVGEDDFALQLCPVCDGFMIPTRLDVKADPNVLKIIRIPATEKAGRE